MATTRKFGIITDVSGVTGGIMINSLDFSESVETAQARDELGRIVDIAAYSNSKTVSIQGFMDTSKGAVATAGSIITLEGKNWLIDNVSKRESNTGFVELTISARTADEAQIYVPSSSSSSSQSSSSL